MTSPDFARMLREAMEAKGLSKRKLGALIGVLSDGRFYDATGIRLIVEGRRRAYDTELVTRLIDVLDLDPATAYEAAGVWPDGLTVDGLRRVLADADTQVADADEASELFRGTSLFPGHRLARLPRNRPIPRRPHPAGHPPSHPLFRLAPKAA